jgi:hypothetical protein
MNEGPGFSLSRAENRLARPHKENPAPYLSINPDRFRLLAT